MHRVERQGRAYHVLDAQNVKVAGPYSSHAKAARSCRELDAGTDGGKARRTNELRKCMCCGQGFASEGPHNRLCEWCRHKDGTGIIGDPGGRVATSRSRA